MKIFISYGHNDYTQLVDRLFDAMIEAGHEPWKDDRYEGSSGIAPGQDFTEVIYKAIDASDFVIAFVTRCTQEKPYCRDERQYAYNKKGTHFIQIRMDNVEITLGNARSYIDMSDTVDSSGRIHEKLFENNLQAIFAAFRDPMSFAEGGITPWTKIDTHLKVPGSLKYHDFIGTLDQGDFVGRQWLLNRCRDWAKDNTIARRLFVIFGEAGTGKTAFIRHLSRDEKLVRSVHVCIYDRPSTRTVRDTLKDLAYVLAHKCDTYYNFLKSENLEKLKDMTEDGMFEFLFLDPLKNVQEKYLLIIDGLDELEETSGLKPLMRIFRQYADRINPNISFLVTTRPDEAITDLIKTVGKGQSLNSITLTKDANREDLQLYIDRKLQELDRYDEALAKKILDACDGNFEYLSLLFKEAQEEGLQVSEDMHLPRGLNERYIQYLDRHMEAQGISKLTRQQRRLLALLCTAQEPIPLSLLADITDADEYNVLDELDAFGSLIHRSQESDPKISLFTKGFRDFLLSKECRRYSADRNAGTELLAQYIMDNLRREKDFTKQPYLDRNGFVHLLQYAQEEPEDVSAYIKQLAEGDMDVAGGIADALYLNSDNVMQGYCAIWKDIGILHSNITYYLKKCHAAAPLAEISRLYLSEGETNRSLLLQADLLQWNPTPENRKKAEQLYQKMLALNEKKSPEDSCYDSMYYLSVAYDGLGDLATEKGTEQDLLQAEQWYLNALEITQQLYLEYPNSDLSRGISISYHKLGNLFAEKGTAKDLDQAMQWFMKAILIDLRNYEEDPCYESIRDLSVTYDRLGMLALRKGTKKDIAQAKQWLLKALELNIQTYLEMSCYESRRDLSISYTRLIDFVIDHAADNPPKQAKQWLTKALELCQQNHLENPCYETRRDLSITYRKIIDFNDILPADDDPQQIHLWLTKALELDQQNHLENPCYETRRDLSIDYHRFIDFIADNPDISTPEQREQWHRESLELDAQNHRERTCYESRRDLAVSCSKLADFLCENGSAEENAQAQQLYLQALELRLQNYEENPCYDTRDELAINYKDLTFLAQKTGFREGYLQPLEWHLAALELEQQNYQDVPDYENRRTLIMTHNILGMLFAKSGVADGPVRMEEHFRESAKLCEENHKENPCCESRHDLAIALIRLSDIAVKKGTEEDLSQAKQLLLQALELNEQSYEEDPCFKTRRSVSLVCDKLSNIAVKLETDEDLKQALHWICRVSELDRQNYEEVPTLQNRRILAISFRRYGILTMQNDTPEELSQAMDLLRASMELLKENHLENPTDKSKEDLSVSYAMLSQLAKQINTPESLVEAEQWDALRAELEAVNEE